MDVEEYKTRTLKIKIKKRLKKIVFKKVKIKGILPRGGFVIFPPHEGHRSPKILNKLDFPQPFGPQTRTFVPDCTSNDKSFTKTSPSKFKKNH